MESIQCHNYRDEKPLPTKQICREWATSSLFPGLLTLQRTDSVYRRGHVCGDLESGEFGRLWYWQDRLLLLFAEGQTLGASAAIRDEHAGLRYASRLCDGSGGGGDESNCHKYSDDGDGGCSLPHPMKALGQTTDMLEATEEVLRRFSWRRKTTKRSMGVAVINPILGKRKEAGNMCFRTESNSNVIIGEKIEKKGDSRRNQDGIGECAARLSPHINLSFDDTSTICLKSSDQFHGVYSVRCRESSTSTTSQHDDSIARYHWYWGTSASAAACAALPMRSTAVYPVSMANRDSSGVCGSELVAARQYDAALRAARIKAYSRDSRRKRCLTDNSEATVDKVASNSTSFSSSRSSDSAAPQLLLPLPSQLSSAHLLPLNFEDPADAWLGKDSYVANRRWLLPRDDEGCDGSYCAYERRGANARGELDKETMARRALVAGRGMLRLYRGLLSLRTISANYHSANLSSEGSVDVNRCMESSIEEAIRWTNNQIANKTSTETKSGTLNTNVVVEREDGVKQCAAGEQEESGLGARHGLTRDRLKRILNDAEEEFSSSVEDLGGET